MGLFSGLAKAGVAKKAFDVAKKPQNQQKIKNAITKLTSSKSAPRKTT